MSVSCSPTPLRRHRAAAWPFLVLALALSGCPSMDSDAELERVQTEFQKIPPVAPQYERVLGKAS